VQFHYALVDDLLSKEEFERRVEEKIKNCGDLVDELTGAMLVVADLGRQHVKIHGLVAKSSLFSFFGKVIERSEPKEFDRADGEKGLVATILVGDETGETRLVLWDEKAMAAQEIEKGDVLEVIGKPGKRPGDIMALAIRKATCEIECRSNIQSPSTAPAERVTIEVRLLSLEEPRLFTRRDGTGGEMRGAVIGDERGTARLISWMPEILDDLVTGGSLRITGAVDRSRPPLREYSVDEKSTIEPVDTEIDVHIDPVTGVGDDGVYSVRGAISRVLPARSFTTKDGSRSQVRNILVRDATGEIRVVFWGDTAARHYFEEDTITIFNATARVGRTGERELSVGRASSISVETNVIGQPIEVQGTILADRRGTFIEDGTTSYLIEGEHPHGREVRVTGILTGHTITPETIEAVELSPEKVLTRCRRLKEQLDSARPSMQGHHGPTP
jgi:replication factor A1